MSPQTAGIMEVSELTKIFQGQFSVSTTLKLYDALNIVIEKINVFLDVV